MELTPAEIHLIVLGLWELRSSYEEEPADPKRVAEINALILKVRGF